MADDPQPYGGCCDDSNARARHFLLLNAGGSRNRHYDESQLAGLVIAIASINAWNRINAATRQITGEWVEEWISRPEPAGQVA